MYSGYLLKIQTKDYTDNWMTHAISRLPSQDTCKEKHFTSPHPPSSPNSPLPSHYKSIPTVVDNNQNKFQFVNTNEAHQMNFNNVKIPPKMLPISTPQPDENLPPNNSKSKKINKPHSTAKYKPLKFRCYFESMHAELAHHHTSRHFILDV